jgi:hypothetical protein
MNRKPLLFVIVVLGISSTIVHCLPTVKGTTWVEGHITEDTTWTVEDSPYLVMNDVIIDANATLAIKPGVEVRFGGACSLVVEGSLYAEGTSDRRASATIWRLGINCDGWACTGC